MTEVQYVGEHLWVQHLGHLFILTSFYSAIYLVLMAYLYYQEKKDNRPVWMRWIKIGLIVHSTALLGIIGTMLFMMSNHFYEFHYVWEHVSDELPMRYILSAFWEGQEGSFLLWMFWNAVMAWLLLRKKNAFTVSNLGILFAVQAILMSMILGVYFFGARIGSNPFLLLRETMDIPLFKKADYVSLIKGNGMNPLLQNYWMLIHPPTLFFGFASTVIPFCYALSSLFLKKYEQWLRPCLPWSQLSGAVLGLGILMGGAWAYEALSFGGYWAWDPVENMSLVPWLVLVGGIHTHLIALNTRYSIKATLIFYFLSFGLVIYSTYLTRSGVLGDTSVHAFTGLGLGWQLVFFIFISIVLPFYFFFRNKKEIHSFDQEEKLPSREFWMFIGALTFLFSAGLICFSTSIPVYNKLLDFFGSVIGLSLDSYHKSAPVDVVAHHNRFQLWIGLLIGLLSGFSIFLKYLGLQRDGLRKNFWIQILFGIGLSALLTYLVLYQLSNHSYPIAALLFASWFCLISSLQYLIFVLGKQLKAYTPLISHMGFGLLLMGILFTGLNRRNIAPDEFFQEDMMLNGMDSEANKHYLLIKDQEKYAKPYWINYQEDTMRGAIREYSLKFVQADSAGNRQDSFMVFPEIQYDNKLTKVAASNPSIKRYLSKDIFTLIAQIPAVQMDAEAARKAEDSLQYTQHKLKLGDTVFGKSHYFLLNEVNFNYAPEGFETKEGDLKIGATITVGGTDTTDKKVIQTGILFRDNMVYRFPGNTDGGGVRIQIPDSAYEIYFPDLRQLKFQHLELKEGESKNIGQGYVFRLEGFDKSPKSPLYQAQENDIAVAANIKLSKENSAVELKPIYLIRDNAIIPIPDRKADPGVSVQFSKINPETGLMSFEIAFHPAAEAFPLEITESGPRTDYIVMETIEFPGINLVWLGSLMMVGGLAIGAWQRKQKPNA